MIETKQNASPWLLCSSCLDARLRCCQAHGCIGYPPLRAFSVSLLLDLSVSAAPLVFRSSLEVYFCGLCFCPHHRRPCRSVSQPWPVTTFQDPRKLHIQLPRGSFPIVETGLVVKFQACLHSIITLKLQECEAFRISSLFVFPVSY